MRRHHTVIDGLTVANVGERYLKVRFVLSGTNPDRNRLLNACGYDHITGGRVGSRDKQENRENEALPGFRDGGCVYYCASAALGVTYKALHLIYIALFSCSFFALISLLSNDIAHRLSLPAQEGLPYIQSPLDRFVLYGLPRRIP